MDQNLIRIDLKIIGMNTENEEILVRDLLSRIEGIEKVYSHHKNNKAEIYSSKEISVEEIQQAFNNYHFKVQLWKDRDKANPPSHKTQSSTAGDYLKILPILLLFAGFYFVFTRLNLVPQTQSIGSTSLWVIFLTGLTVGGLTCLAVQGGLLASVIAEREEESSMRRGTAKHALYATGAFLISKYIAYIALGFLLGSFGGALNIGGRTQTIMQFAAGLYMVAVALNLLNIHPIFRYVIIQPPRFLTRLVRNQSKSKDLFAPGLLGAMTILIPCGTTLAMEALAISSANGFIGATIMAVFILGTMPLFFGIGFITSILGEAFKTKFLRLAAIAVIYLGVNSMNGSLVALGSPLTLQSVAESFPSINLDSDDKNQNTDQSTTQTAQIDVSPNGYSPNYIKVKKDQEVTLILKSKGAYSCASAFRIPSLGIKKDIGFNATETVTFTPAKKGRIAFNCSMGMYRGVIEVV